MKISHLSFLSFAVILLLSCGEKSTSNSQVVVKNTMNANRSFETISLNIASLRIENSKGTILIKDMTTQIEVVSQEIDTDGDGTADKLLFQPEIDANSEKTFEVLRIERPKKKDSIPDCYSRFVPERTDDYAWENNRVAFRTYGPKAQKMKEQGIKGGTLSSGIDAWLKRVDYPIINKWYKKELETDGSYHEDTGEGLDDFHVGISRGVGGIAKKIDSNYHISKNFTSWKTLSIGPIRTSFILTYADWDAAGNKISEEKMISLDYGSNLSKYEITINGIDTISAGLTLHANDGEIEINEENGWITYWEPHEGSELGTAIVVPENKMAGYENFITDTKDESNLFAHIRASNNKVVYYAGFGWKKSEQFTNKSDWENYVSQFAEKLQHPLLVELR